MNALLLLPTLVLLLSLKRGAPVSAVQITNPRIHSQGVVVLSVDANTISNPALRILGGPNPDNQAAVTVFQGVEGQEDAIEDDLRVIAKSAIHQPSPDGDFHRRLEFRVKGNLAALAVVDIVATASSQGNVELKMKPVMVSAEVPQQYEARRHCARTGKRKYIIAGPRDMECTIHHTKRALSQEELTSVAQQLRAQLPVSSTATKSVSGGEL